MRGEEKERKKKFNSRENERGSLQLAIKREKEIQKGRMREKFLFMQFYYHIKKKMKIKFILFL